MIAPPLPAAPPGRIARKAVLDAERGAEDVDLEHLADVVGSISAIRLVISMPALLTRMSRPPSWSTVAATAASQLASSVTSRWTKPWPSPERLGGLAAGSSGRRRSSPGAGGGQRLGHALAEPRAPPVTSACGRSGRSVMAELLVRSTSVWWRSQRSAGLDECQGNRWTIVKKLVGRAVQRLRSHGRSTRRHRMTSAADATTAPRAARRSTSSTSAATSSPRRPCRPSASSATRGPACARSPRTPSSRTASCTTTSPTRSS